MHKGNRWLAGILSAALIISAHGMSVAADEQLDTAVQETLEQETEQQSEISDETLNSDETINTETVQESTSVVEETEKTEENKDTVDEIEKDEEDNSQGNDLTEDNIEKVEEDDINNIDVSEELTESDLAAEENPVSEEKDAAKTEIEASTETQIQTSGQIQIIDGKAYLLGEDGNLYEGGAGTPVVNGEKYWVNTDGSLNAGWLYLGNWKMYFDPETYTAKTGLTVIDNKTYMFDSNGVMQTKSGTPIINGEKYWINTDGSLNAGWLYLGDWKMYFDPETYTAKTGLTVIEEKTYMFDSNGVMQTKSGTPVINGHKYWVNTDGSLNSGWLKLGNMKMYFDPNTYQAIQNTFYELDGKTYYFDENGVMGTGTMHIDGYKCVFDDDGALIEKTPLSKAVIYAEQKLDEIGHDLRVAFNWSASLTYFNNGNSETGAPAGYKFEEYEAIYGFENLRGDCEVMAATFYYMAQSLGYDVHMVRGFVPLRAGGMGHHAWCEIVMNGTVYVFDPQFTNQTGRNGYQITYGTSGTWVYSDYYRIN